MQSDHHAVLAYLATQESAVLTGERRLRAGEQQAVHPSRVAVRRSRSTLRTFAPLFHTEPRDRLDQTLRGHAARLGDVRDLEVLAEVLAEHLGDQPELTELAEWVGDRIGHELETAWSRLEEELAEHSPGLLQDHFAALLLDSSPHDVDLQVLLARSARKARHRLARAGEDAEALHEARKAAKRARYAAEAVGELEQATAFEQLQGVLGDHHDRIVAAQWLDRAPLPGSLREAATLAGVHLQQSADGLLNMIDR